MKDALYYYRKGLSSQKIGWLPGAVYNFKRAVELDTSLAIAHVALAYTHFELGNFEACVATWEEYTERSLDPRPPRFMGEAYLYCGIALDDAGDFREALEKYDKGIECGRPVPLLQYCRG